MSGSLNPINFGYNGPATATLKPSTAKQAVKDPQDSKPPHSSGRDKSALGRSNGDGDVLELRGHGPDTLHAGYARKKTDPNEAPAESDSHRIWERWALDVKNEIKEQLIRTLEESIKGPHAKKDAALEKPAEKAPEAPPLDEPSATSQLPEYWNAENTSDRIVAFATSFFALHGGDAREFGEKMIKAVSRGFEMANAEMGPVSGETAKLTQETRELVFSKLDKWIEAQSSTPYT